MGKVNLSKLDVAKRELEHAIKLFFNNGDFVIVHLVVSACQDILEAIGGNEKSMRMNLIKSIKKEKQAYLMGKLKYAYNFFKHADRDSKKLLEFNPEASEFAIFDSIGMYQSITGELTGLMGMFRAWFYLKYPDLLPEQEQKKLFSDFSGEIDVNNKQMFLDVAEKLEKRRSGI